jgi:hypothetical protein
MICFVVREEEVAETDRVLSENRELGQWTCDFSDLDVVDVAGEGEFQLVWWDVGS